MERHEHPEFEEITTEELNRVEGGVLEIARKLPCFPVPEDFPVPTGPGPFPGPIYR